MNIKCFAILAVVLFLVLGGSIVLAAGEESAVVSDPDRALELSIEPGAETYAVREKISFDLVLANVSKTSLMIRDLDERSTFCDINGQQWGQKNSSGELVVVLDPGETIRRKFRIGGARKPGKFVVECSYGMGSKGIRPAAERVINIVR